LNSGPCDYCAKKKVPCVVCAGSQARTCILCSRRHASCVRSDKQGASQGQTVGQKRKQAAVAHFVVLSEGSEEEPAARAPVPKRLVAISLKPVAVLEKSRVVNMPLDQWWDRKLEPGPDDHLLSLVRWAASVEIWQRDQRELWQRVVELEARMNRQEKGKGKEKEDAEEE